MNIIATRGLLLGILQFIMIISFLESKTLSKEKIANVLGELNRYITREDDKMEEGTIQEYVNQVRATNPHLHKTMEIFAELERRSSSLQKTIINQACIEECEGNFYACLNSDTGRVGFAHVYDCKNQKAKCLENICDFQHGFPNMM